MVFINKKFDFDFMGQRKLALFLSTVLVLGSIVCLFVKGLNLGIDFTGGTLIEVGYAEAVELDRVRSALQDSDFGDAVVQYFGSASDVLIRVAPKEGQNSAEMSDEILNLLRNTGQSIEMRRFEFVWPQVGDDLT